MVRHHEQQLTILNKHFDQNVARKNNYTLRAIAILYLYTKDLKYVLYT